MSTVEVDFFEKNSHIVLSNQELASRHVIFTVIYRGTSHSNASKIMIRPKYGWLPDGVFLLGCQLLGSVSAIGY